MINWKWPATKRNNLSPWYTIVRRSIMLPFAMFFTVLLVSAVFLGWGKETAISVWEDIV